MRRAPDQSDFFRTHTEIPREPERAAPYQPKSIASKQAGEKIAPAFGGNRQTCLSMIRAYADRGGITRKQIAAQCFEAQQQYVTGPVAVLIEDGFIYEEPLRDPNGIIMKREDGTIAPRRVDGSAVLLPTEKARASA